MIIPKAIQRYCAALAVAATFAAAPSSAQEPEQRNIFDLDVGMNVHDLNDLWFQEYGCGDDGGPPLLPLAGWTDFGKCAANDIGLFEIYFCYNDACLSG